MADETFRPRRPKHPNDDDFDNDNDNEMMDEQEPESPRPSPRRPSNGDDGNFKIQGNVPAEFLKALQMQQNIKNNEMGQTPSNTKNPPKPRKMQNEDRSNSITSSHLKELLEGLKGSSTTYEEIELPSKGRFYDGNNGPTNGVLSIRPMTGEEEQILATPRFVKKGQAINMIFRKCLREQYRPEDFLTIDRTYLLIYLRGISYSPNYEVEVKCPDCDRKFATTINLDTLYKENCPDDFGPILQDVLPQTKLPFTYRLSTGDDEQIITEYRENRARQYGDSAVDDTLIYRTATLLDNIDGITSKNELLILLKNLPISDVSYIRNCISEPPFGVDTNVEIVCPNCMQDFEVDLPMEANFFFPRRKKGKTQA